jgi:hypothetical protein
MARPSAVGHSGETFMARVDEKKLQAAAPGKPSGGNSAQIQPATRKRILTGDLSVQVADLDMAMRSTDTAVKELGGYVAASSLESGYGSLTLRVPAERYGELLAKVSGKGRVISTNSRSDDVSDSWYDLENRIRNKKILLERYQTYLRQAKNVEELMTVERQVNETIMELEQLEGSFRNLDDQVAYSTLTVYLRLPGSPDQRGFNLRDAFAGFLRDAGEFFQKILIWLLYLVVLGIPLALLAALSYLLLFGRIGLLRKLFRALSPQRKNAAEGAATGSQGQPRT